MVTTDAHAPRHRSVLLRRRGLGAHGAGAARGTGRPPCPSPAPSRSPRRPRHRSPGSPVLEVHRSDLRPAAASRPRNPTRDPRPSCFSGSGPLRALRPPPTHPDGPAGPVPQKVPTCSPRSTTRRPTADPTAADPTRRTPSCPAGPPTPDLWFAESPADVEAAKALCVPCPLREACLAGALERREPWGVWGGQLVVAGVVVPRKRPRGRPRKSDVAAAGPARPRLPHLPD